MGRKTDNQDMANKAFTFVLLRYRNSWFFIGNVLRWLWVVQRNNPFPGAHSTTVMKRSEGVTKLRIVQGTTHMRCGKTDANRR